jgi:hypothetical protein
MRTCHRSRASSRLLPIALLALASACASDGAAPTATTTPDLAVGTGGSGGVASNTRFPVTFELKAGTCGLTTDVVGTGEWHALVRTTAGPDGQTLPIGFNNSAHGTAVGDDGTRYVWSYHNNRRRDDFTGAPPFQVHWTDHFVLVGQGSAPDVHTFFNVYFTIEAGGARTYLREVTIGDPDHCDPI